MKTQHQLLRTVNRELEEDFKLTGEVGQTVQMFQHISEGMKQVRLNTAVSPLNMQPENSNIATISSKLAAKLCRKVNQNAWTKSHGKDKAESASDLKSLAEAVYELAQSTSVAHVESGKLVLTVLGLGISLPAAQVLRSLSSFLKRDLGRSHISPREWLHYALDETTVTTFLEKQQRKRAIVAVQPAAATSRETFSLAVQLYLANCEATLKEIRRWWQFANRKGAAAGTSRVAQSLTEIGCFSNPVEASGHIQRLLGGQSGLSQDDFTLLFVRGFVKFALVALTKVLGSWKKSGMSLTFQLSMLKKNLLLSGLRYKKALIDPSQRAEAVVHSVDEAQQELYGANRVVLPVYQQRRPVSLPRGATQHARTLSAGEQKPEAKYKEVYSKTLQEMQDVVSYIPDVNLFLVLADGKND